MMIYSQTCIFRRIILLFENTLRQIKFPFPVQHDCNVFSITCSSKLTANYIYSETFQDSVLDSLKGPYGIPDIVLMNTIYVYFKTFSFYLQGFSTFLGCYGNFGGSTIKTQSKSTRCVLMKKRYISGKVSPWKC